jgi:hypothetical protein
LDFRKAFNSISWDSLDRILASRGFDDRWRLWVSHILTLERLLSCQMGCSGGG